MEPLEALGFALAGYGCTTCIGNSGPLDAPIAEAIEANDLVVAAVLSGNRNFEGRIHPLARASYLASPPLVVAFALAGRVDIDLTTEPLGIGDRRRSRSSSPTSGRRPTRSARSSATSIDPELFRRTYAVVFEGDERWRALPIPDGDRYDWDPALDLHRPAAVLRGPRRRARAGRRTSSAPACWRSSATRSRPTTSRPAGSIAPWSPAGEWLQEHGVDAARVQLVRRPARPPRGDDARHVRQHPAAQRAGRRARRGRTPSTCPTARRCSSTTRRCATRPRACRCSSSPAGSTAPARRATGRPRAPRCSASAPSSPRATSASTARTSSGMGVLPLQFLPGESAASLGLTGREAFAVARPRRRACRRASRLSVVRDTRRRRGERRFEAIARLDGPIEVDYYRQGGILPAVLRRLATEA